VNLWEPGIEQTVFTHPEFRFSTPICFEDIFPDYVRNFALKGADVILNISNDYWSLTETEGKQHFMTGMMRAVENRRPLVRCTASGLTGVVELTGKIRDTQPFYKPLYVNTQIELHSRGAASVYLKYGDWFARVCIAAVLFMFIKSIVFSFLSSAAKQKRIRLLNKNK
jgi:apolipoprotein N-acyltransferase